MVGGEPQGAGGPDPRGRAGGRRIRTVLALGLVLMFMVPPVGSAVPVRPLAPHRAGASEASGPPGAPLADPRPGNTSGGPSEWPQYEFDLARSGDNRLESNLSVANAQNLSLNWTFHPGGPVEGGVTVVNGTVYFGSWDGYVYALNATNGSQLWRRYVGQVVDSGCPWLSPHGPTSSVVYHAGHLFVAGGGSVLFALNATNGTRVWSRSLGANASSGGGVYLWSTPTVYDGWVYEGIASGCDSPLVAGELRQFYESNGTLARTFASVGTPSSPQVGGAIWSTPAVDPVHNVIWITTGNEEATDGYSRSVVALNATTLAVRGYWQQPNAGYDYDFGAGPTLLNVSGHLLVSTTNKDGYTRVFNATNVSSSGWKPVWADRTTYFPPLVHPPADSIAPAAFDGQRLFIGGGETYINGTWSVGALRGIDPSNGSYLWQTRVPGMIRGGVATADGLVAAAVSGEYWNNSPGVMRYLPANNSSLEVVDAANGSILFHANISLDANGPAVIADGRVLVGTGSASLTGWNKFPGPTGAVYCFSTHGGTPPNPLTGGLGANRTHATAPGAIAFVLNVSGGAPPYSVTWEFGDGTAGSVGPNASHVFTQAGTFDVLANVSDAANHRRSFSLVVAIAPALDVDVRVLASDGLAPGNVTFGATVKGGLGPYSYRWTFSDGLGPVLGWSNVTHRFALPGPVAVTVRVGDANNATVSRSANTSLSGALANLSVAVTRLGAFAPEPVQFNASWAGGIAPFAIAWSFGDGSLGSGAVLVHTYTTAGTYPYSVNVSDGAGESRTASGSIDVAPGLTLDPSVAGATSTCTNTTYQLLAGASGGVPPVTVRWVSAGLAGLRTGSQANISLAPGMAGSAEITATDSAGEVARANLTFGPAPPGCTVGVSHSTGHSALSPLGLLPWVLAAAGVLALGAVLTVLFVLRRGRSPPGAS